MHHRNNAFVMAADVSMTGVHVLSLHAVYAASKVSVSMPFCTVSL